MREYLLPSVGLALLWGVSVIEQAKAGDAGCCACETGCPTAGCATCSGEGGCQSGCKCCPHCGCKLVPVCNITCVPKTTTEHKYCCECKEICIPGVSRPGQGCEHCGGCGASACGCDVCICEPCNEGCPGGNCHCRVREIHKLMVCPVTKETSVKQCTVKWVCPNCDKCPCEGTVLPSASPSQAPAAPTTLAPPAPPTLAPPAPPTLASPAPKSLRLPPAPKTTEVLPPPEDIRTAQAGF